MKKVPKDIIRNTSTMKEGLRLPFRLISFFENSTEIEYKRIVFSVVVGKFINMIVMFLPIKILFVLSGAKNIGLLEKLQNRLGSELYLTMIVSVLVSLYFGNTFLQIHRSKLINRQKQAIDAGPYVFRNLELSENDLASIYPAFCQVIADFLIVTMVFFVLVLASFEYALFYASIFFAFSLAYEQWVFTSSETTLLKRFDIDEKSAIQLISMMMFLALFFGILALVLNTDIDIITAILLFLIVRLSNNSFKSYIASSTKLRRLLH